MTRRRVLLARAAAAFMALNLTAMRARAGRPPRRIGLVVASTEHAFASNVRLLHQTWAGLGAQAGRDYVWLDRYADNDPRRFESHMVAMMGRLTDGATASAAPRTGAGDAPRDLADWMLDTLSGLDMQASIFLDEFQALRGEAILRNADACVTDLKTEPVLALSQNNHTHLARVCEFDGICDEIAENLPDPHRVTDNVFWNAIDHMEGQSQVLPTSLGLEVSDTRF